MNAILIPIGRAAPTDRAGPPLPGFGLVIGIGEVGVGLAVTRFVGGRDPLETYLLPWGGDEWQRISLN
ncbi:MAG: hypothetical protein KGL39_46010 [Patescibacteria group bacterium]|nr:hypothetical protein [Patescibacteria group bacterium]